MFCLARHIATFMDLKIYKYNNLELLKLIKIGKNNSEVNERIYI